MKPKPKGAKSHPNPGF
jgi:hypothetical protein